MTISDYAMKAGNGKRARIATKIVLSDGREFEFTERMSRRMVLTQLENMLAMAIRHNKTEEIALFTDAVEEYVNESGFKAVSA